MPYVFLAFAIVAEVIGTSALKASEGFSKTAPLIATVVAYGAAFYCLSVTLKTVPVGVAYAIWPGVGVALIALAGWLLFDQKLDAAAIIGLGLIVAGVVAMQVFSKASGH
jgi:small multidrug resistance pump